MSVCQCRVPVQGYVYTATWRAAVQFKSRWKRQVLKQHTHKSRFNPGGRVFMNRTTIRKQHYVHSAGFYHTVPHSSVLVQMYLFSHCWLKKEEVTSQSAATGAARLHKKLREFCPLWFQEGVFRKSDVCWISVKKKKKAPSLRHDDGLRHMRERRQWCCLKWLWTGSKSRQDCRGSGLRWVEANWLTASSIPWLLTGQNRVRVTVEEEEGLYKRL